MMMADNGLNSNHNATNEKKTMRMTKVCIGLLLLTLFQQNIVAQSKVSATVFKQEVEQMISGGETRRRSLKEAGGYDELVDVDYENYNDDRVQEVIVVQKAGCISAGMSYIWNYRKTRKGYQKIYGPISGDDLKLITLPKARYLPSTLQHNEVEARPLAQGRPMPQPLLKNKN